jgi:transposase
METVMHKNLKFNIIFEAQEKGVSATCQKYNISRTIYYRWLKRYKAGGIEALNDIKKDFVPVNKTSTEIENVLFSLIKTYPHYGPKAIKYLLEEVGYNISESAVFNVMKRHALTNKESRIRFSKRKDAHTANFFPSLSKINSGECWIFWITNYGSFENIGTLYEYTIFDFKSRIACTRLYHDISFDNFEDLLTAVAIPVAQTLNFSAKYLCFFQDSKITKQNRNIFNSKISKIVEDNGLAIKTHFLTSNDTLTEIHELRKQYTEVCLAFLIPLINNNMSFNQLKMKLQNRIRTYNLSHKTTFDNKICSPIEYHNKLTNTPPILPLWAYINRQY